MLGVSNRIISTPLIRLQVNELLCFVFFILYLAVRWQWERENGEMNEGVDSDNGSGGNDDEAVPAAGSGGNGLDAVSERKLEVFVLLRRKA